MNKVLKKSTKQTGIRNPKESPKIEEYVYKTDLARQRRVTNIYRI